MAIAFRDRRDGGRYLLGVECDGATYHSAKTARDRDLLRQQVLRGQGWRLHRLWSTDWFRDREGTLSLALAAYERALKSPIEESALATPIQTVAVAAMPAEPASTPIPVTTQRRHAPGEPYQRFRETRADRRSREQLMTSGYHYALAEQITQIVSVEGPIHVDVLTDR